MATFRKVKIKDIANEHRDAYSPSTAEDIPYIGLEHIEQQTLRLSGIGKSSDVMSQKKRFVIGDVLYGSLRPYFRKVYKPKFNGICSTDITVLKSKSNCNNSYLFYLIASPEFISKASGAGTGTKMPRAGWKVVKDFIFDIPDLPTQSRIASVLSAYDDLIENNEKRIKILEEMAQRLYTEWFVKFKFPGHEKVKMVDSGTEYGMIPDGWELAKIDDLFGNVKRKVKLQTGEYQKTGLYPIVDQGKEFIAGYTDIEDAIYNDNLIVFGDHTRCFKYCNFPFACGADGTQLLKTNDFERMPQILMYFSVANAGLQNYNYARHFKSLKALNVLRPDSITAKTFNMLISRTYDQIRQLRQRDVNVGKLRDLLIPQLVTGKRGLEKHAK